MGYFSLYQLNLRTVQGLQDGLQPITLVFNDSEYISNKQRKKTVLKYCKLKPMDIKKCVQYRMWRFKCSHLVFQLFSHLDVVSSKRQIAFHRWSEEEPFYPPESSQIMRPTCKLVLFVVTHRMTKQCKVECSIKAYNNQLDTTCSTIELLWLFHALLSLILN